MDTVLLDEYLNNCFDSTELTVYRDYPLSKASSFCIGGNAKFALFPKNAETFCKLLDFCKTNSIYNAVIGNGSNVLFSDNGFDGAVIFTSNLSSVAVKGTAVTAQCGASFTHLASIAAKNGLSGLEFAFGIPGTLGGAVFMNAGAYGGEIRDVVRRVDWYNIETKQLGSFDNEQCRFDYRSSVFQDGSCVILSAELELNQGDPHKIREVMDDLMSRRKDKQPLEYPSAGSTFKRYPGYFTGKLIEEAGLKGFSVGGAQVSEKHAGFVINKGNATAKDVLELIDIIKNKIFEINGIHIECEIRTISESE